MFVTSFAGNGGGFGGYSDSGGAVFLKFVICAGTGGGTGGTSSAASTFPGVRAFCCAPTLGFAGGPLTLSLGVLGSGSATFDTGFVLNARFVGPWKNSLGVGLVPVGRC